MGWESGWLSRVQGVCGEQKHRPRSLPVWVWVLTPFLANRDPGLRASCPTSHSSSGKCRNKHVLIELLGRYMQIAHVRHFPRNLTAV